MLRNVLRAAGSRAIGTLALLLGLPSVAPASPLLSEVFYDAVGSDDGLSFVELYGLPGTDLTGMLVEGINGTGGTVTDSIALSGVIPAGGLFVIADGLADGTTQVGGADLIANGHVENGYRASKNNGLRRSSARVCVVCASAQSCVCQ